MRHTNSNTMMVYLYKYHTPSKVYTLHLLIDAEPMTPNPQLCPNILSVCAGVSFGFSRGGVSFKRRMMTNLSMICHFFLKKEFIKPNLNLFLFFLKYNFQFKTTSEDKISVFPQKTWETKLFTGLFRSTMFYQCDIFYFYSCNNICHSHFVSLEVSLHFRYCKLQKKTDFFLLLHHSVFISYLQKVLT